MIRQVKRLGGSLDELGELFPISQGDDGVRASARQDFAKLRASKLINPLVEIRAFVCGPLPAGVHWTSALASCTEDERLSSLH